MDKWDGKERRNMESDWLSRDRMLSEIHSDVKHLSNWAREHDQSDNNRFEMVNKRVSWIEKVAYMGIGGLAILNILIKLIK